MSATVLIADDEPNIVEALSFILDRENFDVSSAYDGETAVQKLLSHPPDIMILDIMLPKQNGFEVLKLVKADPGLKNLPVIILTAKGQSLDRKMAEDMGADAFVTKPFSNKDIVATIKNLLAGQAG